MVLAKADAGIAADYDRQLVPADLQDARRRCSARGCSARSTPCSTSPAISELLADNPVLRRSIDVRNPYVDPINLVQVELLRRLRDARDAHAEETDAGCAARCS